MGKIAVVRAFKRHDYGPFGSVLHIAFDFSLVADFFSDQSIERGPSAQKRRIRPILAHEPGVLVSGAWEPHTSLSAVKMRLLNDRFPLGGPPRPPKT